MALVVMRAPLDLARSHGQQRSRAIEGLHRRLLVDTQHQRGRGGLRYKPRMSRTFFTNKGWTVLNVSLRWGWSPKDRQMRPTMLWLMPVALAIDPGAPVGRIARSSFQGLGDHLLDRSVGVSARGARAWLIAQAIEPARHDPSAPLPHRLRRHVRGRRKEIADEPILTTYRNLWHLLSRFELEKPVESETIIQRIDSILLLSVSSAPPSRCAQAYGDGCE